MACRVESCRTVVRDRKGKSEVELNARVSRWLVSPSATITPTVLQRHAGRAPCPTTIEDMTIIGGRERQVHYCRAMTAVHQSALHYFAQFARRAVALFDERQPLNCVRSPLPACPLLPL